MKIFLTCSQRCWNSHLGQGPGIGICATTLHVFRYQWAEDFEKHGSNNKQDREIWMLINEIGTGKDSFYNSLRKIINLG